MQMNQSNRKTSHNDESEQVMMIMMICMCVYNFHTSKNVLECVLIMCIAPLYIITFSLIHSFDLGMIDVLP